MRFPPLFLRCVGLHVCNPELDDNTNRAPSARAHATMKQSDNPGSQSARPNAEGREPASIDDLQTTFGAEDFSKERLSLKVSNFGR